MTVQAPDITHRYIVAYDVADDRRRSRIAKTLGSYGDRVQYSVFIVDVKPAKFLRLQAALARLVHVASDSVLFCDLGPVSHGGLTRITYLGLPRTITGRGPLIL